MRLRCKMQKKVEKVAERNLKKIIAAIFKRR